MFNSLKICVMKTMIFLLTLLIAIESRANLDTITLKTKITDVTVFLSGAQVTRKSDLKLKKGKQMLLIDQLPQELDPLSIQTKLVPHYKILAVKHLVHQKEEGQENKEEKILRDQIQTLEDKIKDLENQVGVFDLEEKLLMDNSFFNKKTEGSAVNAIKEAADFYRLRLNEIRHNKLNLVLEQKKIRSKIQDIYTKISELPVSEKKVYSQIFLTIDCEKENPGHLTICYYVSTAGWQPLYDFRVEEITEPLSIAYNAHVFQNTGEEWKNVNVTLSTTNPSLSGERKKLLSWYIDRKSPYDKSPILKHNLDGRIKCELKDKYTGESIPFGNVVAYRDGIQVAVATTNIDGEAALKPLAPGRYTVKGVYVGYQPMELRDVIVGEGKTAYITIPLANGDGVRLNEVVVSTYQVPLIDPDTKTGQTVTMEDYQSLATKNINSVAATSSGTYEGANIRGGRENNGAYFVDGVKTMDAGGPIETIYFPGNIIRPNITNMQYVIDVPYSIPSDGEDYTILIKETSIPVNYIYHAVPKLEPDVFLSAEIANWSSLNLLSGTSSIYFQGTYVGQSYLDVAHTGDTLSVSLGRDRDVMVTREINKLVNDKHIGVNNIKETVGTNIVVRNNKNSKIKLIVEDQYPLSEHRSVEVDLLETASAKVDERSGKITWDLSIEPSAKKNMTYKYSLRYPKWTRIVVE
jgi:hypothetical protein